MPLTATAVRNAKPRAKAYKLADERGLYLMVTPSGGRLWRFDYRFEGKRRTLAIGPYPELSLSDARDSREEARRLLTRGVNPAAEKAARKRARQSANANSFAAVAWEWHAKQARKWVPYTADQVKARLERDILPWLGSTPVEDVDAAAVLRVLRRVESRGAVSTAHRLRQTIGQVMRYAVATGRSSIDPTPSLKGALEAERVKHFAAPTDPKRFGEILRALDDYQGTFTVRCALRLAPLVFVRPGELRKARWADVDLGAAEWRYLVTKTNAEHVVPLADQAVEILRELHAFTGTSEFLFPSARSWKRPMSDNAILAALRRSGIAKDEMTGHGLRATARTLLDEVLGFRVDLVEHQLAHAVRDPLGRAYNRTAHLVERRKMMQSWADYLDQLRAGEGSNVVAICKVRKGA